MKPKKKAAGKPPSDRATRHGKRGWEVCFTREGMTMVLAVSTSELGARRKADKVRYLRAYDDGRVTVRKRGSKK